VREEADMTANKASRVQRLTAAALAIVGAGGVLVAAPHAAVAAPWTISAVSDGTTAAQLAQTLVGSGVTINNAAFTGEGAAAGLFDDPAASVGLSRGVVMSSGRISDVIGPNSASGTGEDLGQPGDTQLDALLPSGQQTQDAASLTVEFTPTNPQLAINYVFASEEYEEYVGSKFNDVFAFFVNGINCALTPGTNAPITVNTVNQNSNTLFYVPNDSDTYDTEFDGFTVVLTCRAAVNPGVKNTLRLVIADTSDGILDSGVFLQASGVSSNPIGPLQPITPNRLLDTRELSAGAATGLAQSIVPGGSSISLKVTGGDVPETALAVALNITAVGGQAPGFLTVFPDGGPQPGTSSVNFPLDTPAPNSVVAKIGTGGRIRIFASQSVQVVVDVFGWFGPGGDARLFTVAPDRVLDTRTGGTPVGQGQTIDVQIAGTTRVPVGATAAVLNVTATEAAQPGFLTVFPSDRAKPFVSSVNFVPAVPRPNLVIAPLGADGKIKIFASQQSHVIVDVMGWFGNAGQAEYVEVASTRLLDTRRPSDGGVKINAGATRHLQVVGAVVPPNARSVVLNVTITEPDQPGFLTVYPGNGARPPTSNLNYLKNETIPNAVIVGLGFTGTIDLYTSQTTYVVVDVVGYFA